MNFPLAPSAPPLHPIPKRRKKSRAVAMSGGMMILDWFFLAVGGLGLGILLLFLSILAAFV